MNFKDSIRAIFSKEKAPDESTEEFLYNPSDWYDRNPKEGANRVIRVGGGVRTCVFPVPHDERFLPSYLEFVSDYAAQREKFNAAIGSTALNNEN